MRTYKFYDHFHLKNKKGDMKFIHISPRYLQIDNQCKSFCEEFDFIDAEESYEFFKSSFKDKSNAEIAKVVPEYTNEEDMNTLVHRLIQRFNKVQFNIYF